MENVTRVGIDLGKQVFHVTAVDAEGAVVERRRLRRAGLRGYLSHLPRGCEVAMESCGGAHHWARLALKEGLRPALLSPQFVKPYVKSNKNDVADADAIAEASSRPGMRFVEVKSVEQEHVQQVHRARQLALKQATAQRNQLHALLLEYGIASLRGTGALLVRLAAAVGAASQFRNARELAAWLGLFAAAAHDGGDGCGCWASASAATGTCARC